MKAFVTDVSRGSVTFFRGRGRGVEMERQKPVACGRGGVALFGPRERRESASGHGCEIHASENSARRRIESMGEIGI